MSRRWSPTPAALTALVVLVASGGIAPSAALVGGPAVRATSYLAPAPTGSGSGAPAVVEAGPAPATPAQRGGVAQGPGLPDRSTLVLSSSPRQLLDRYAGEVPASVHAGPLPVVGLALDHPVSGSFVLSSVFGWRINPTDVGPAVQFHIGQDYAVACGTPVRAAADGTVTAAGYRGTGGLRVDLRHAGGLETAYRHASRLLVVPGDRVSRGDVIALSGTTGNSTGCHLHFDTLVDGRYVDPALLLPAVPGQPRPLRPEDLDRAHAGTPGPTDGRTAVRAAGDRFPRLHATAPQPASGQPEHEQPEHEQPEDGRPSPTRTAQAAARPSTRGADARSTPPSRDTPRATAARPARSAPLAPSTAPSAADDRPAPSRPAGPPAEDASAPAPAPATTPATTPRPAAAHPRPSESGPTSVPATAPIPGTPTVPDEPTQPAAPVAPEPSDTGPTPAPTPADPPGPAPSNGPATPAGPGPQEPTPPIEPAEPTAAPAPTPADPGAPTEPVEPTQPVEPAPPDEPDEPAGPTEPTAPAGPTAPPAAPAPAPTDPGTPTEPVEPTQPDEPVEPDEPAGPTEPTAPAAPSSSAVPDASATGTSTPAPPPTLTEAEAAQWCLPAVDGDRPDITADLAVDELAELVAVLDADGEAVPVSGAVLTETDPAAAWLDALPACSDADFREAALQARTSG